MESDRDRRAEDLANHAARLDAAQRDAFFAAECGSDEELRREVESRLPRPLTETQIVDRTDRSSLGAAATKASAGSIPRTRKYAGLSVSVATGRFASRLFGGRWRRGSAVLLAVLFLITLGLWTRSRIKHSLRDIRGEQLRTILSADVLALKSWIEERRAEVEQWARDDRVRQQVIELVRMGNDGTPDSIDRLWNSPPQTRLFELVKPYLEQKDSAFVTLVDPTGTVLANNVDKRWLEDRVSAKALVYLSEVLGGKTVFVRPMLGNLRKNEILSHEPTRPYTWTATPVRDVDGRIIASLNFAKAADGQFSEILHVARMGKTGETYAFDADGLMLSESRFVDDLKSIGLVPDEPDASATLSVTLRDPGRDLTRGRGPVEQLELRPWTRLVARALAAHGRKGDSGQLSGLIVVPYLDYRGIKVIGAWQWLPEYAFGVATEVGAAEAFAPLIYLDVTFGIVFCVLVVAVGAAMSSSFSVVRLRKQVGKARQLGQYTLERKIGEGGMGTVYLAHHAMLKRPTAVKMLRGDQVNDQTIARFEREVQLASQLSHPNTIEIYDYGRTSDGVFYYAMEYLPGLSLAELIRREGAIPAGRVIRILRQVCLSLREAHGLGLIHRDIKPHNIMLCQRGGDCDVVKVLDFGLVKNVTSGEPQQITRPLQISGTPLYMAPERFRGGDEVDARSDIYSVGAVGYNLLTGQNVFDCDSDVNIMYKAMNEPPELPSRRVGIAFPRELERLIMDCLAKDIKQRPRSASDMLEILNRIDDVPPWTDDDARTWWKDYGSKDMSGMTP